jgi:hypothetical protein
MISFYYNIFLFLGKTPFKKQYINWLNNYNTIVHLHNY